MTDIATAPRDHYGLPKIDVGPTGDESQRDHNRAPLISGGTITGQAFQTAPNDPRIVVDSNQLVAHKADGTQTIKIDVNTGYVSFLSSTASSGGVQFVDATGTVVARVVDDPGLLFSGFLIESASSLSLLCDTVIGSSPPAEYMSIIMETGATSPGIFIEAREATQNHAGSIQMPAVSGAISRVVIENNDAGVFEFTTFVGGHLALSQNAIEKHIICTMAAFTTVMGMRFPATAAGAGGGVYDQHRQVRGNTNGGLVTPGGAALGGVPIANVNANTPAVTIIRADGCRLTAVSTAAGNVDYINSITFS